VPELDITDRPTAAAHLAAFGSDNARRLYQTWLSATQEIRNELWYLDDVAINVEELWLRDLRRLRDELQPNERRARQALADAIAKELDDHRKAGAGDHPSDVEQ
jgi:hypothetical protein